MLQHIEPFSRMQSVAEVWSYLSNALTQLGFPFTHYTVTRVLESDSVAMPCDKITLSNLPHGLIERFRLGDLSQTAPLHRWLNEHGGVSSLERVFNDWDRGALSPREIATLTAFLERGHLAAYGISLHHIAPRHQGTIVLGAPVGMTQPELDLIWDRHHAQAIALASLAQMRIASLPFGGGLLPLTQRQREVLECISAGKSTAEIAEILKISAPTVEKHLRLARSTLGVRTTAQAIVLASLRNQIFIAEPRPLPGEISGSRAA
ncbi:helix-turn-helix transcriptional regulator [Paracoccus aminophilus]|uniref:Transcriptional regulator, LuxR family n=1 Tax=Paracoccus aminophilus JCM 7686 TaxID=1367847 RepID=S5YT28_PARAH|nr:LuxR C-terminal-related transcriptional regulator [Paracoccus aminophilus]AGT08386.1 transcriptional regulator, LuxR family [Paracoccus aminophilus JCM 7686]